MSPSNPRQRNNPSESCEFLHGKARLRRTFQTQKCPANCRALLLALNYVTSFLRLSWLFSLLVISLLQPSWLEPSLLPFWLPF